jgi:hypothetical protein
MFDNIAEVLDIYKKYFDQFMNYQGHLTKCVLGIPRRADAATASFQSRDRSPSSLTSRTRMGLTTVSSRISTSGLTRRFHAVGTGLVANVGHDNHGQPRIPPLLS